MITTCYACMHTAAEHDSQGCFIRIGDRDCDCLHTRAAVAAGDTDVEEES